MYRINLGDSEIKLPEYLSVQERIKLCEMITEEYPEFFTYEIPPSRYTGIHSSDRVKRRLRIMGEYIFDASPDKREAHVITRYKQARNYKRELPFSALERTDSWKNQNSY